MCSPKAAKIITVEPFQLQNDKRIGWVGLSILGKLKRKKKENYTVKGFPVSVFSIRPNAR